jgi:hypothetical protein
MPVMVRIQWPLEPTVCEPRRYTEIAAAAMKLLAEASTTLPAGGPSTWHDQAGA